MNLSADHGGRPHRGHAHPRPKEVIPMSLLELQEMELPTESSEETVLGSGRSQHCSDASWVFC
jgi:hypothetical protein